MLSLDFGSQYCQCFLVVQEFDLDAFSSAQFQDAITQRRKAEDLSAVLYPNAAWLNQTPHIDFETCCIFDMLHFRSWASWVGLRMPHMLEKSSAFDSNTSLWVRLCRTSGPLKLKNIQKISSFSLLTRGLAAWVHQASKLQLGRSSRKGLILGDRGDMQWLFLIGPLPHWEVAVQMNDTHPTIAVAEMMRLLASKLQVLGGTLRDGTLAVALRFQGTEGGWFRLMCRSWSGTKLGTWQGTRPSTFLYVSTCCW